NKPNKVTSLSLPVLALYVVGLSRGASGFTTRPYIGPAREGLSEEVIAEEAEADPKKFQVPDNKYGLFPGTTYKQDFKLIGVIERMRMLFDSFQACAA
ncbi:hypothetical protein HYPSUDRAFT_136781, partial [Hypholoma sublateritium FD-334 SS-4]